MRYLTKEWYDLCQKQGLHFGMRVHKGAAQKDEALYLRLRKRKEKAFIEMERGVYDCDPRSIFEMDGTEFVSAEKWTTGDEILEADTIIYNMPQTLKDSINERIDAYDTRAPFDEDKCRAEFNEWQERIQSTCVNSLSPELYAQIADLRVYALGYCTKEMKSQLIKCSEENKLKIDAISEACNKAQKNEKIPKDLLQKWGFHDSNVATCDHNRDLIIRMDEENAYTGYNRIIFHDAKIIKQEKPMEGFCWLYDELYRNEDGYEAHILFLDEGFYDLDKMNEVTISCKDITIDKD